MAIHSKVITLACLLLLAPTVVLAGAWTPERGRTYLKFSANLFESDANFNLAGDSIDPFAAFPDQFSEFTDENLNLYFETGITNKLALFGSFTYKRIEQHTKTRFIDISIDNSGLADFELGARYQLTEGKHVWAVALLAKFPYFYEDDDDFFQLGNGQEDFELRVLYGTSLGKGFYTGAEAAYRYRTEEPSNEYKYLLELGWSSSWGFYTRAKLDGTFAVDDFEASGSAAVNPILSPIFDATKLELTAGYQIRKYWGLEYSFLDVVSGKNTADGEQQQLAIVFQF
jgi:hypothetical protein